MYISLYIYIYSHTGQTGFFSRANVTILGEVNLKPV